LGDDVEDDGRGGGQCGDHVVPSRSRVVGVREWRTSPRAPSWLRCVGCCLRSTPSLIFVGGPGSYVPALIEGQENVPFPGPWRVPSRKIPRNFLTCGNARDASTR